MERVRHGMVRSVTNGARHIEYELLGPAVLRVGFVSDGGEGAEEEIADVGEDSGAARGNAILRKKAEEIGQDLVEVRGGLEFGELAEEVSGEVGILEAVRAGEDVFGAETGGGAGDGVAATAAGAGTVLATGQVIGGAGVDGLFVHGDPHL